MVVGNLNPMKRHQKNNSIFDWPPSDEWIFLSMFRYALPIIIFLVISHYASKLFDIHMINYYNDNLKPVAVERCMKNSYIIGPIYLSDTSFISNLTVDEKTTNFVYVFNRSKVLLFPEAFGSYRKVATIKRSCLGYATFYVHNECIDMNAKIDSLNYVTDSRLFFGIHCFHKRGY